MTDEFISWLKRERRARNLSIRQLGELSGISHSQIAKVERKEAVVTWDFCVSMARVFQEPVWKLFLLADLIDNIPEDVYEDEVIRVLVDSFMQLPDQGKEELLNYAAWLIHRYTDSL